MVGLKPETQADELTEEFTPFLAQSTPTSLAPTASRPGLATCFSIWAVLGRTRNL